MSKTQEPHITPLTEVLEDAHNEVDNLLRQEHASYTTIPEPEKKARRFPLNPDRVKSKSDFNSEVHEAAFTQAEADGALLHNSARPPVIIAKERPEHRFLVFLYSQGLSTKDIFIQLGGEWDNTTKQPISGTGQYTYQHLHTIRRQAWFQRQLIAYMESCGKDIIRAKLEAELVPSIDMVIEIRDDVAAPKALRLKAADSLIDRFLGKPVQQVVTVPSSSVAKFEDEAAELAKETLRIETEIKQLNPGFHISE